MIFKIRNINMIAIIVRSIYIKNTSPHHCMILVQLILAQVQGVVNKKCYMMFERYQLTYNKKYESITEKQRALYSFCNQIALMNNQLKNKSYKTRINYITDNSRIIMGIRMPNKDSFNKISNNDFTSAQQLNNSQINQHNDIIKPLTSSNYYKMDADTYSGFTDEQLKTYNRQNYSAETQQRCAQLENNFEFFSLTNSSPEYKKILWDDTKLPKQVDLRKSGLLQKPIDQGACGSCYAIATMYAQQTLMYRDALMYAQLSNGVWNASANKNKLSVQYIMNRTFGMNMMCQGGNYVWVSGDLQNGRLNTLELQSNFPYTSMFESTTKDPGIPLFPDAKVPYLVDPLYHFAYSTSGTNKNCPITIIQIIPENNSGGFSGENEQLIKSVLARGVAVVGQMHTEGSDQVSNSAFQSYSEGVFDGECIIGNLSNHQITFVGYGTYKGVPVWIIQNTWGVSWGIQGTFMVRRGVNTMCTEWIAYFQLNRFFNMSEELDVPWFQNPQYLKHKGLPSSGKLFIDENANLIRTGLNGLDFENGTWLSPKVSPAIIAVFLVMGCAIITIMYFFFTWCCCMPRRPKQLLFRIKMPNEQKGKKHDRTSRNPNYILQDNVYNCTDNIFVPNVIQTQPY